MVKYKLTIKAVDDLSNIWNYTLEKWSEKQADKYYNMLVDSFNEIARNRKVDSLRGLNTDSGLGLVGMAKIFEHSLTAVRSKERKKRMIRFVPKW